MTRRRTAAALVLTAALAQAGAVYGVRIADHYRHLRLDLAAVKAIKLDDATRRDLAALGDDVLVTYYTSARSRMPSSMRRLEGDVVDLLDAMARASAGRLSYQIVDPDAESDHATYAARQRVAPFRARSVAHDSYSERTVWSSLAIADGARPQVVINAIEADHLPRLQSLVMGTLRQLDRPRRPIVAVSSPAGFSDLRDDLSRRATLVDVDLDRGDPIPPSADLLFWIEPARIDASRLLQIDRFLDSGRSLVVAGSEFVARLDEGPGEPAVALEPTGYGMEPLVAAYGVRPVRGLLLDSAGRRPVAGVSPAAALTIRCIAPNQSFGRLRGQPGGSLLFVAPTPLLPHPERLAESGFTAEILATTGADSRLLPVPPRPIPLARLAVGLDEVDGVPASKQPLMVWLRPADPWRGSIVALAGSTPFDDASYHDATAAHARLVDVLLRTLASDERLVAADVRAGRDQPTPALEASERLLWRGLTVLFVPTVLFAIALARGVPRRGIAGDETSRDTTRTARIGVPLLGVALAFLVATAVVRVAGALPWRIDVSENQLSRLAPATRELARGSVGDHALEVDLFFSGDARLPPRMRPEARRLSDLLSDLRASGADLRLRRVRPEALDDAERQALSAQGIEPIELTSRDGDTTEVRSIYSAVRLRSGAAETILRFPDVDSFENLEFRLAFALWRARTGRGVHVALAPDSPRLTPAEVHEEYQQLGRFAPTGADVYAVAAAVLRQNDFQVTPVNPQSPILPEDADLLIWLQPRRRVDPMLEAATRFLRQGRPVMIAAQHFNLQARQYQGRGHAFVYWPQPQWPELENLYLPDLGVHLEREVLFDELATTVRDDAAIFRGPQRELREQQSALPFVLRASAANYASSAAITRGLGDQALIWGSYFRLDHDVLATRGISARVLMTTSPRAWSYTWTGGFLPEEVLSRETASENEEARLLDRVPLAVELEGVFPLFVPPAEDATPGGIGTPEPAHPARLVLIGGSELFKNHRILDRDFRADHLLLNTAAALTLDPDLASVLARRAVARGFQYVEPERRLLWRVAVVGGLPLGLLLFAAGRRVWIAVTGRARPHGCGA